MLTVHVLSIDNFLPYLDYWQSLYERSYNFFLHKLYVINVASSYVKPGIKFRRQKERHQSQHL